MGNLNKTFLKVTGNTWDVEKLVNEHKISEQKLSWMIPDGAMLNNPDSPKYQATQEFMTEAAALGLQLTAKVQPNKERTADNVAKPKGKGWVKVVTVEAQAATEAIAEYWTLDGVDYTEDPTYEVSTNFDYVHDETSWNASAANGGLKLYYEVNPSEDLWNTTANRAANFNDRHYMGNIGNEAIECMATWASENAQSVVINDTTYYMAIFYHFDPCECELFNDVALTESANITFNITNIDYANCVPCWDGAVNAPGSTVPWIVPYFTTDVNAKIIFRYENMNDVYPWGEKIFGTGENHKVWGVASIKGELGIEAADFDENKFQMVLEHQGVEHHEAVPAQEAVEEVYHWERDIVEG